MSANSYTTRFEVEQTPDVVFAAINDVRAWWGGEIAGDTASLGAEFTYRYEDMHRSRQRVAELVPGRKVVWQVVDAELSFVEDTAEWTGTQIVFDIARMEDKTEVRFTHVGLVPTAECFSACSDGWSGYIMGSLRTLIEAGRA
jgi:hypothetical protein